MAFVQWKVKSKTLYQPANFNANSADDGIITVGVGDIVGAAFARVRVAYDGTSCRVILGDGTTANGYMAYGTFDSANTGLKQGIGTALANTPGYLYTSADLVSVGYNIGAADSTGVGRADFFIWVAKADPY